MKTDYFNLIESKVNTEAIIKKKISKLLKNKQIGGVIPVALQAAKTLAKNQKLQKVIGSVAKTANSKLKSVVKNAKPRLDSVSKTTKSGFNFASKTAKSGLNSASKIAKSGLDSASKTAKSGLDSASKTSKSGLDSASKTASKTANVIGKYGKNISNNLKESYEKNNKIYNELKKIKPNTSQSPSYPKYLQVVPRDPHMTKKLSSKFKTHLEDIQEKINDTSNKIDNQLKYVEEEQRILDKKKEVLDNIYATSVEETSKRSWDMIKAIGSTAKWFADSFMSFIRWMFLLLVKLLIACQPLMWAIAAIICVFVLIMLISWLLRGGRFKIGNDSSNSTSVNQQTDDDNRKEQISNNYNISGSSPDWNLNNFIKNPIQYTLEKNLNDVKTSLDIPSTLNKLNIQNPIYTLRKNFNLLNNDNLKKNRTLNGKQRDDNVSFINYSLIDNKISDNYFTPSTKNENYSINLLKPKNIEWELPHLDYKNTDMNKLPESIKNYKDNNDPNSFSLNDTSKIIFPWKLSSDKWTLDCNTKFTNNEPTGLYDESSNKLDCEAIVYDSIKFNKVN